MTVNKTNWMRIQFQYKDNNNVIVNSITNVILFSNYLEINSKHPDYPIPYARNPYNKWRPDDTEELGADGNLYQISYFHYGLKTCNHTKIRQLKNENKRSF